MRITKGISAAAGLAVAAFCLVACDAAPDPNNTSTGGAAGDQGPGYCDAPPADMTQLDHWNQLCSPGRRS